MPNGMLVDQVATLLETTQHAHHQAFIEVDGADPDWPLWYAEYLMEGLSALVGDRFTKSELVYLLFRLGFEQPLEAPSVPWSQYYARVLVQAQEGMATMVGSRLPFITGEQMVEVDRAMIEDYGIQLAQMMENAGRCLAHLARTRFLGGDPRGKRVVVLAGSGGNGGGALVAARRLHNYGAAVRIYLTKADNQFTPVPAQQLAILRRMDLPFELADAIGQVEQPDLVLDGVIGYSLKGAPRGSAAELIRWANGQQAPVLSLDVPSGVESSTGRIFDPAIRATATMTLALPKEGLRAPGVDAQVGELYLADISVPPELYGRSPLNLDVDHLFAQRDIIRLS